MFKEFKKFIMRGNVVDLAIAVVVGAAFTNVVNSLVSGLITPLIAAVGGQRDFSHLSFSINGSQFMYGQLINAVISFLLVSAVIFFLVVQPLNKLKERSAKNKNAEEPTERKCPECLSEIPKEATRCRFCTSKVTPAKTS